jgi:hypothetical protein
MNKKMIKKMELLVLAPYTDPPSKRAFSVNFLKTVTNIKANPFKRDMHFEFPKSNNELFDYLINWEKEYKETKDESLKGRIYIKYLYNKTYKLICMDEIIPEFKQTSTSFYSFRFVYSSNIVDDSFSEEESKLVFLLFDDYKHH